MCLRFVAGLTGLKDVSYFHYFTKVPPINVGCIRQPHFGFSAYRHTSFYLPHLVKRLDCLTRHGVINNDEIIQLNITHPYLQVLVVTVDSEDNAGMLFTCLHTNDTLKAL